MQEMCIRDRFYCSLAGIRADASARERIRIQPCFPEGVDWVDCRTLTPAGMCRVYWERKEEYILSLIHI